MPISTHRWLSYLAHYLYFGICGLILSPCPFSPQLARRRRSKRKTKKKQKKEDEEEEEERCSPNWVISDPT
jgi:hypothetical protein